MYCIITTTFENKEEANQISKILLEKRLVACCQITEIESKYWWKEKIETTPEYLVQMKTKKSLYNQIESEILELHSYDVPEIVMYEIQNGSQKYLNWIEEETR